MVPWVLPVESMTNGPSSHRPHLPVSGLEDLNLELDLALALSSSNHARLITLQPSVSQENPNHPPLLAQSQSQSKPNSTQMAFQCTGPMPFLPYGMHLQNMENRKFMVRAVTSSRPAARHKDWAIATIQTLPGNVLNFQAIHEVLDDFFVDEAWVQIHSI